MKKYLPKNKPVSIYGLHIPAVVLILILLAASAGAVSVFKGSNPGTKTAQVLGEDEDGEDEDESEDEDKDDDEDEDKDEERSDEDESGKNDDEGKDEDDDDEDRSGSGGGSDDDDNDEDENEIEDEDEIEDVDELDDDDEDDDRDESVQVITNADGTKTWIKRKVEGNEIKVETKTYDQNGRVIKEEKFEQDESGQQESKVKIYTLTGEQASELKLKTEDGKLELKIEGTGSEESKVAYDPRNQKLILEIEGVMEGSPKTAEGKLAIGVRGNSFVVSRAGAFALAKFPLTIDPETGKIFVETPNGAIELSAMPDSIVETAKASQGVDDVESLDLDESGSEVKYKLTGVKSEKLLGIFSLQIPASLVYDVGTGEFLGSEQSFVTKILDLFSF